MLTDLFHTLSPAGRARFEAIMRAGGVRGGDGSTTPFEDLTRELEGIADLSDERLAAIVEELRALAADAPDDDEGLALLQSIVETVERVEATLSERETAAEARATQRAELLSRIEGSDEGGEGDSDGEGDAAGDGDDAGAGAGDGEGDAGAGDAGGEGEGGEADGQTPEQIAAAATAATPPAVPARTNARRPASMRPRRAATASREFVLTAAANVPGVAAGTELRTADDVFHVMERSLSLVKNYRGPRVEVPLFQLGAFDPRSIFGEERTLDGDRRRNEAKIAAVCSPEALTASGGICAPSPIDYTQPVIGTDSRPVRDGLARFGADRGGVRTMPPPLLTDMTGAVGAWTEANDINPVSPTTKPCLTMTCPDDTETIVDAITRCLKVGNFRARFFPEQVAAWVNQVGVWHARFAESRMLTEIGAGSTAVTVGQGLGTTRDLLAGLDRAAAQWRNRYRISRTAPLRWMAPEWLLANIRTDLAREVPGASDERLAVADAMIESFFSARNINVTWFLDGESGQIYGAQHDGGLLPWSSTVVTYLFEEGTWLFLDGGTLDLGLVRDSTLNATNDFQMWAETFENVHFHGRESQRITFDICPSGKTSAAAAFDPCTLGS